MHFGRSLPSFVAFFSFVLLEIFLIKPKFIYFVIILINLLIISAAKRLVRHSLIDKAWWNIIILPIVFSNSLVVYSVLLPKASWILFQALLLLNVAFLFFYFRAIYLYLILPSAEKKIGLENISLYGNFLSFFFISSAIYGLQSFLNTPIWLLILVFLALSCLLIYQVFWSNKIGIKEGAVCMLVCCLVLTELAWSIFYLPFNFNVSGFILAIYCYILIGLARAYLQHRLNYRTVKLYLGLGLFSILAILFTARWL